MSYDTSKSMLPDELAELLATNPDLGIEQGTLDGAADYLQTDYMPEQPDSVTTTNASQWQYLKSAGRGKPPTAGIGGKPQANKNKASGNDVELPESEADFLLWCIDLLRVKGWRVHHTRPAWSEKGWRTPVQGDVGFFDLVAAKDGRVLLVELKTDKGRLTRGQLDWQLAARGEAGAEVTHYVDIWQPADRERIEKFLE